MTYRKDIQILRGIAVLLVVLFHLEMAGFASGFLGVDVFFVISGYLMAMMYQPQHKVAFFLKRAKRLLPAYFVTIGATVFGATLLVTPNDYQQVVNQSWFAVFFASNIGFWSENSYFDKAAFKPLLHLWSLGVEIQFYLWVPVFYWLFKKHVGFFVLALLGSLAACFFLLGMSPKTSFFWMPMRLWQFLLGVGCCYYLQHRPAPGSPWWGAAALLAIVAIPFAPLNGEAMNAWHGHPGVNALAISLATSATLLYGLPKIVQSHAVATLLERLGGYSYSIYLAHFPVIVLFLYQPFHGTVTHSATLQDTGLLIALIVAMSFLLYCCVERPFRHTERITYYWPAAVGVILLGGALGSQLQTRLIPSNEMKIYQAWFDRDVYRCGKINRLLDPLAKSCEITENIQSARHRVLLVGNSHADSIKATFSQVAAAQHTAVYFMVENNPMMKGGMSPQRIMQEARLRQADTIVLHYSPEGLDLAAVSQLLALNQAPSLKLAFLMPVPVWRNHVPMALLAHEKTGKPLEQQALRDYLAANQPLSNYLSQLPSGALQVYATAPSLCQPVCAMQTAGGQPLYFDSGHLTLTGSALLAPVFQRMLAELDAGRQK